MYVYCYKTALKFGQGVNGGGEGLGNRNEFFLLPRVDSSRRSHWSVTWANYQHVNDGFRGSYRLNSRMRDDDDEDSIIVGQPPDFPTGVLRSGRA